MGLHLLRTPLAAIVLIACVSTAAALFLCSNTEPPIAAVLAEQT